MFSSNSAEDEEIDIGLLGLRCGIQIGRFVIYGGKFLKKVKERKAIGEINIDEEGEQDSMAEQFCELGELDETVGEVDMDGSGLGESVDMDEIVRKTNLVV